ncbi:unnamed protein product [Linum trigynum]|uniref:HhH-GPD domain-containing protein n=1 Tax=Linum trigynum TaxID=586398 RepID=A0AAV2FJE7_9ROSI
MDSGLRSFFQAPSVIYTDGQGNPVQQQQHSDWLSGFTSPAGGEFEACNAIELDRWKDIPFTCLLGLDESRTLEMGGDLLASSAWNTTPFNLGVHDPVPAQYDLNLPHESTADSSSFGGIDFLFAPVTPHKAMDGTPAAMERDVRVESRHGLSCGETADKQAAISPLNLEFTSEARNVVLVPDPVPDSSSTIGLTTQENQNREKVDFSVIDLNKTPPTKKPKRKKHVPKVLVEGKKPKTPKPQTPKQPKRKYEKKNKLSPPAADAAAAVANGSGEVEIPNSEESATSNANQTGKRKNMKSDTLTSPVTKEGTPRIKRKYTRKGSRDSPTGTVGESEAISGGKSGCTTLPREATGESVDPQGRPQPAKKSCRRALDFSSEEAGNQRFTKKLSSPSLVSEPVAKSQTASISFGDGIEVRMQNTSTGSPFDFESSVTDLLKSYSPKAGNQANTKGKGMLATQSMQQYNTQISLSNASSCSGSVRTLTELGEASVSRNTNSSPSEPGINVAGHFYNGFSICQTWPWTLMPECRKKRGEKAQNSAVSSIPIVSPAARTVDHFSYYAHSHENRLLSGTVGKAESAGFLQYNLHSSSPLNEIDKSTKRRSKAPVRVHDLGSLVTIPQHNNQHIQNLNRREVRMGALLAGPQATLKKPKKNSKRDSLGRYASSSTHDKGQHGRMVLFNQNQFSGSLDMLFNQMLNVDELAEQLKHLNINRERPKTTSASKELVPYRASKSKKKQNAMVIYRGDDRMVPFETVKRKRPRAKVEIDDETLRVFNLLLKSIDSEGIDGTDEAKAKYWEEERRIFRGRTNTFIARMHLVQGDRRFSKWKGSVVDSVIGVFLTQNVSDHLSSSAFMAMAARFPIKRNQEPQCEEGGSIVINPTVSMPDDECLNWDEMSNQSISDQISMTLCDPQLEETEVAHNLDSTSSTSTNICLTPGTENYAESVISSQTSSQNSNSPVSQTFDNIKESCTETNSQEADTCDGGAQLYSLGGGNSSLVELQQNAQSGYTIIPKEPLKNLSGGMSDIVESSDKFEKEKSSQNTSGSNLINNASSKGKDIKDLDAAKRKAKSRRVGDEIKDDDWEALRRSVLPNGINKERAENAKDSVDWEAVRCSDVDVIARTIKARGMNNVLAGRLKEFLNKLITYHGSIDLEWLRDVPPDRAKEYLLSFNGLGLKSVECVRLLTLHHLAFPVDTNVGRIAVRLGWVPLQPLPDSLQLHLLEMYPILDTIQKYLWPRLCKLDQKTLYELHYQLITFGKVFCTKSKPNCNACPMRGECRHFASAFASSKLLPGPEEKRIVTAQPQDRPTFTGPVMQNVQRPILPPPTICEETQQSVSHSTSTVPEQESCQPGMLHLPTVKARANCEPIIEEPLSPEPQCTQVEIDDIEDAFYEDPDEIPTLNLNGEIPTIPLNVQELAQNIETYIKHNMQLREGDISLDLVAMATEATYIPPPKLKNISRLRTEHQVYELHDTHPLVKRLEKREADDPSPYLLAIWTPGETAKSVVPPQTICTSQSQGKLCDEGTCLSCCSFLEARRQVVRGTILIPCRTAMRGSFPLNGTYYQVNEVFADHETSKNPIDVPREWLWDLPRRTVYFGTSVPTIFRGLTTEQIQQCFWKGFVCIRGFDRKTRAPRPLQPRLHLPASKMKEKEKDKNIADDDE